MKLKGIILTMLSAIAFGFGFTLGPMTYGSGGSNPATLTFLRNFLSIPFLIGLIFINKINLKVTKKQLINLIILALFGNTTTTLMLNTSFAYIDVGVGTSIQFTYPVFVTLGCVLLFHEKFTKQKFLSLFICMSGIALFFIEAFKSSSFNSNSILGLSLALATGIFYSFYMIFLDKSGLKSEHPLKVTLYVAIVSSISTFLYGLFTNQLLVFSLTTKSWIISFIFAILCNVVALSLIQVGIKHVGSSAAAVISTFEPITSVIFGVILLDEKITSIKIIACILIIIGVLVLSYSKEEKDPYILSEKEL
ncbi:MAG: DMT family transporter [Tissierellia bacterium]|nr:DMT family transporter [Tissierellia bacterium]MDD4780889.1 DMT family transporter [Tissierellia bacterium]